LSFCSGLNHAVPALRARTSWEDVMQATYKFALVLSAGSALGADAIQAAGLSHRRRRRSGATVNWSVADRVCETGRELPMRFMVEIDAGMEKANAIDAGGGPGAMLAKLGERFKPEAVYGKASLRGDYIVVDLKSPADISELMYALTWGTGASRNSRQF
jgi:hypothetical protein